jgi:hypothetical protein
MMAQTASDTTASQHSGTDSHPASAAGTDHAAATVLSQQIDLMARLNLKDPTKQTTTDLLQNGYINVTPIDAHSAMNEPHKFLSMASKMVDGAPGGDLTYDLLDAAQKSSLTSKDEKTVAKTLNEEYMDIATDDPHSLKRFTKYVGFDIDRSVRQEGLDQLKDEQQAADAFAKHPELKGPQSLAYSFKTMFENVSDYKASSGFSKDDLGAIAASNKYSEQERAAAEFVKLNFDKFATMSDKTGTTFNAKDLIALAKTEYAAGVGLVSKGLGSKHPLANALVAGASMAIATEIKNQATCGEN